MSGNSSATVTNSYATDAVSSPNVTPIGGSTGRDSRAQATYAGFDFTSI